MWGNNIKQHYKVKIPLNFSKLCSEVDSLTRETTLTVEWEVTPTQNNNYFWRLRWPIFSRKWTIFGSFIMLNLCIYLLKRLKRRTNLGYPGVIPLAASTPGTISWINLRYLAQRILSFHWSHHLCQMRNMTKENDPYKSLRLNCQRLQHILSWAQPSW